MKRFVLVIAMLWYSTAQAQMGGGMMILSTVGATCTLEREGKRLTTLTIPKRADMKVSLSDNYTIPPTSHAPVTITCSAPGYHTGWTVNRFGPVGYEAMTPLCASPAHPTPKGQKSAEECARHNPGGYGFKVYEYREIVRLPLEPEASQ